MIDLPDLESQMDALTRPLEPQLLTLLHGRIQDSIAVGLGELTHIVVIERGDGETDMIDAMGFSPLRGQPEWDWLECYGRWLEAIYTVGNSGFAFIVLTAEGELASRYRLQCP